MKDQLTSFDPDPYLSMCAWCGKAIPEDTECFGVGGKATARGLLRKHEGRAIIMLIGDREVPCIVATRDSRARKEGKDFIFTLCSEECGHELKATYLAEKAGLDDSPPDSLSGN